MSSQANETKSLEANAFIKCGDGLNLKSNQEFFLKELANNPILGNFLAQGKY